MSSWLALVRRIVRVALATPLPRTRTPSRAPSRPGSHRRRYPGDYPGVPRVTYAPSLDGDPDPGEIVWTWVPFEEDHRRGKDRPVLLIGHDGPWLLALMLSTRDHEHDAEEARWGRRWMDIGAGPWDSRGRPSEVRLDRIIRVDPAAVRREGALLDRALFEEVAGSLGGGHR